jgi:hypothetical protein
MEGYYLFEGTTKELKKKVKGTKQPNRWRRGDAGIDSRGHYSSVSTPQRYRYAYFSTKASFGCSGLNPLEGLFLRVFG